jgi:hypothetical protein
VGLLTDWQGATNQGSDSDGLNATTALYAVSEPTPRVNITHRAGSGVVNADQLAVLQGAGVDGNGYIVVENLDPGLTGVAAKLRNLSQGDPNWYPGMLTDLGLTNNPNS